MRGMRGWGRKAALQWYVILYHKSAMPLLCEAYAAPPPAGPCAVNGASPEALLEILRPEVNLAIWARETPPFLRRPLARLVAMPFQVTVESVPDALPDVLAARLPRHVPPELLLDIRGLAIAFATIARHALLRARLEVVTGHACPRFHADAVGLRLLCTYRGAGTQWLALPGGAAAARGLGEETIPQPENLPAGAAAILKGEGYPGNAGRGCIHRSPPMPPGAPARLLLCLDEAGRIPL